MPDIYDPDPDQRIHYQPYHRVLTGQQPPTTGSKSAQEVEDELLLYFTNIDHASALLCNPLLNCTLTAVAFVAYIVVVSLGMYYFINNTNSNNIFQIDLEPRSSSRTLFLHLLLLLLGYVTKECLNYSQYRYIEWSRSFGKLLWL